MFTKGAPLPQDDASLEEDAETFDYTNEVSSFTFISFYLSFLGQDEVSARQEEDDDGEDNGGGGGFLRFSIGALQGIIDLMQSMLGNGVGILYRYLQ